MTTFCCNCSKILYKTTDAIIYNNFKEFCSDECLIDYLSRKKEAVYIEPGIYTTMVDFSLYSLPTAKDDI